MESEEIENLGTTINNKHSIVNVFISTCMDCSEHKRIFLLNEIANKSNVNKKQVILLFSCGNKFEMVKEFCVKNNLRNMTVGLIQDTGQLAHYEYYRIFKLDIDPRMFIFNKDGNLSFAEDIKNRRKISSDFITKEFNQ
jgi:hypothetical protein